MLSTEDNEALTRVGPGTLMGELFRRFWMPALTSAEIRADGTPIRTRLLGEDLVAFRDTDGKVGILGAHCPHRLAPLFFGRNEECGLRCVYHGWKFSTDGECVDMPNEPPERQFKERIHQLSYPTTEAGGVVWVYMGPPAEKPASVPQFEWVQAPPGHTYVARWLQATNWCQGMEGEIDTSHASFMHRQEENYNPGALIGLTSTLLGDVAMDGAPKLTLQETPYGFTYGARRNRPDQFHWRVTRWFFPYFSLVPGPVDGGFGRAWVPIDDHHTWTFTYQVRADRPFTQAEVDRFDEGGSFPPRTTYGTYRLPDGYRIDGPIPTANLDNDFLIDREMQRRVNFTGIWGINEQDRSAQEGMGPIVDRSKEHLGTADIATIAARRLLLKLARKLRDGELPDVVNHPELYRLRAIDTLSTADNLADLLAECESELGLARL